MLIAHRGNLHGRQPDDENTPAYVDAAIGRGFHVEVDLWVMRGIAFLGHDAPAYQVNLDWLQDRQASLWLHCKNTAALSFVVDTNLNWFFHENDPYTLTSHGHIWCFPGKPIPAGPSVALWFEAGNPLENDQHKDLFALCGDNVADWIIDANPD